MPSILAYVHAYVPDHNAGAETTLHDILKNLVLQGWEANVVLKYHGNIPGSEYDIDGVHVVVPSDPKRDLLHYMLKADVTISHLECSERLHLMSQQFRKPTIHLVHNTHPLTVGWMQHSDGLIINTEWIANEQEFKDFKKPKIVLNPPVDPGEYKTTRGKSVTLVNLWENKGSAVFYELARRFSNVSFLGVKGGYGIQVVQDLPNVSITEHTPKMKEVFSKTKVLLMPSTYESFGRVGVEAMASGIPTIATPTPGLQESLGASGTFCPLDDMDCWEKSLRDLLKPAKYGKMSKLATARSKELADLRDQQLNTMYHFIPELIRVRGL